MLNVHRVSVKGAGGGAQPAIALGADTDFERAPVVFGWLLYRQDRFAGAVHLETLYRLDRVGSTAPRAHASLQPSPYYGQTIEMLLALLRAQQHTRLPHAPTGCRWLGPQLITEVTLASTDRCQSGPCGAAADALPAGRSARLALARTIARRLLHGPEAR